jgi:hypothetical protein
MQLPKECGVDTKESFLLGKRKWLEWKIGLRTEYNWRFFGIPPFTFVNSTCTALKYCMCARVFFFLNNPLL